MPGRSHRLERHGPLGTVIDVAVTVAGSTATEASGRLDDGSDELDASTVTGWILDEVGRLESVFSVHDPSSELSRWRRGDHDEVSPELGAVLGAALEWQERSGGAFNPLASVMTDRWAAAAESGVRPSDGELDALATAIAAPAYAVDNGVVRRRGDCSAVTLNAIAKGAIVDLSVERAQRRFPIAALTVSAGGDLLHRGPSAAVIGIENPHRPYDNEPPLLMLSLSDGAIATSGGARRGVRVAGEWVGHVVDPRSGRPAGGAASATVVAADVCTADAVATICTVMDVGEATSWLEEVHEADALLVAGDGEVVVSSGFWDRVARVS